MLTCFFLWGEQMNHDANATTINTTETKTETETEGKMEAEMEVKTETKSGDQKAAEHAHTNQGAGDTDGDEAMRADAHMAELLVGGGEGVNGDKDGERNDDSFDSARAVVGVDGAVDGAAAGKGGEVELPVRGKEDVEGA